MQSSNAIYNWSSPPADLQSITVSVERYMFDSIFSLSFLHPSDKAICARYGNVLADYGKRKPEMSDIIAALDLDNLLCDKITYSLGLRRYPYTSGGYEDYPNPNHVLMSTYRDAIFGNVGSPLSADAAAYSATWNVLSGDIERLSDCSIGNILQLDLLQNYLLTAQLSAVTTPLLVVWLECERCKSGPDLPAIAAPLVLGLSCNSRTTASREILLGSSAHKAKHLTDYVFRLLAYLGSCNQTHSIIDNLAQLSEQSLLSLR